MLSGMCRLSFTRFTESIASPSEALGARLNDSVTTGNWPWCVIAIGTALVSSRENALSGTWPPFGKCVSDGAGPDSSGDDGEVAEVPPAAVPDPACAATFRAVVAAL